MTQEDAQRLAAEITAQFPHAVVSVGQSADQRNAPRNWFVAVERKNALVNDMSLVLHSRFEWMDALTALHVLQK